MFKILPHIKMLKKKQLKKEIFEPSIASFSQSLGLSYIYTIKQQNQANKLLIIEDINQYWCYYKPCLT